MSLTESRLTAMCCANLPMRRAGAAPFATWDVAPDTLLGFCATQARTSSDLTFRRECLRRRER